MTGKTVDKTKEDEKQLKKLLDSYTTVAAHKLGRPPTLEDLTKMLTENQDQEQLGAKPAETPVAQREPGQKPIDKTSGTEPAQAPQEVQKSEEGPKILGMHVFYGMSGDGEAKKPDPTNILFYKHPDGRYYDCTSQVWSDTEPVMARHLPSRPIQFSEKDIVAAIANGVMDQDDFESLDKAKMIGNTPRRLWELTQKLTGLHDTLQKSDEVEESEEEFVDPDLVAEAPTGGTDAVSSFMATAGVEPGKVDIEGSEQGEDIVQQIMEAAVAAVKEVMSEELEARVRAIVREELSGESAEEDLPSDPEDGSFVEV